MDGTDVSTHSHLIHLCCRVSGLVLSPTHKPAGNRHEWDQTAGHVTEDGSQGWHKVLTGVPYATPCQYLGLRPKAALFEKYPAPSYLWAFEHADLVSKISFLVQSESQIPPLLREALPASPPSRQNLPFVCSPSPGACTTSPPSTSPRSRLPSSARSTHPGAS